jgi:hypothetical protein
VFGHSANNADKYIKYNKLSDGNWQFIIDNLINWQSVYMSWPLAIKHYAIIFTCNVFNFVLLGQLTFNYFKMHLLNNQLCLYLILLNIFVNKYTPYICTPRTELVHRTCGQWSTFSIVRTQNKYLHREIYAIYFWCIVFQIVFQVFQTFECPEENLDSWSGILKFLCCYFKRMLIIN